MDPLPLNEVSKVVCFDCMVKKSAPQGSLVWPLLPPMGLEPKSSPEGYPGAIYD